MKFLNLEPDKENMFMATQTKACILISQETELKGRAKQGIKYNKGKIDIFSFKVLKQI
jgi:hypothetical protein